MNTALSIGSPVIVTSPGSCYDGERGRIAEQAGSQWGVSLCRVVGVTDFSPAELSPEMRNESVPALSNSIATGK